MAKAWLGLIVVVLMFSLVGSGSLAVLSTRDFIVAKTLPKPPSDVLKESLFRTGPLEVAKVFGRAHGCEDATPELINDVSNEAVRSGIDPRIAAATVAIESACDSFAVSNRGAIGYMQITPKTWGTKYDFMSRYNLLNMHDNVHVGVSILSALIHTYGVKNGVRRYQGLGVGCESCDDRYTDKIMFLAGTK
jgi:hypothetical protein